MVRNSFRNFIVKQLHHQRIMAVYQEAVPQKLDLQEEVNSGNIYRTRSEAK
jgi:hypothetical protein